MNSNLEFSWFKDFTNEDINECFDQIEISSLGSRDLRRVSRSDSAKTNNIKKLLQHLGSGLIKMSESSRIRFRPHQLYQKVADGIDISHIASRVVLNVRNKEIYNRANFNKLMSTEHPSNDFVGSMQVISNLFQSHFSGNFPGKLGWKHFFVKSANEMLSDLQHTLRMTAEWRRKFKELRREMEYYMRLEDKKERRAIRKVKEAAARRGRNNL